MFFINSPSTWQFNTQEEREDNRFPEFQTILFLLDNSYNPLLYLWGFHYETNFWLETQEYQTNNCSKILSKNIRGLKDDPILAGVDVIKCKCTASRGKENDTVLGQSVDWIRIFFNTNETWGELLPAGRVAYGERFVEAEVKNKQAYGAARERRWH